MSKSERRSSSIKPAVQFFEIMEQTRVSVQEWLNARQRSGPYVFPSRVHDQPHLTARQYARIVHGWIEGAGMESSAYGTHSMRRTKAAQIYRKTGNLRAVQLLLDIRKSKAPSVISESRSTTR